MALDDNQEVATDKDERELIEIVKTLTKPGDIVNLPNLFGHDLKMTATLGVGVLPILVSCLTCDTIVHRGLEPAQAVMQHVRDPLSAAVPLSDLRLAARKLNFLLDAYPDDKETAALILRLIDYGFSAALAAHNAPRAASSAPPRVITFINPDGKHEMVVPIAQGTVGVVAPRWYVSSIIDRLTQALNNALATAGSAEQMQANHGVELELDIPTRFAITVPVAGELLSFLERDTGAPVGNPHAEPVITAVKLR